jgi:hypothetical protein
VADWKKLGVDVVVGGAAGVADQLIQNYDEKRGIAYRAAGTLGPTEKVPFFKQFGTYYNYGLPLLGVIGVATGFVKGDWATRVATISGQLAGRKATHQFTTGANSPTPSAAYQGWQREAAMKAARERAARTYEPEFKGVGVL